MCLQGWQVLERCSVRDASGVFDVNGFLDLGDMSRAVLVHGADTNGNLLLVYRPTTTSVVVVPADNRYGQSAQGFIVYTRDSLGPYLRRPLFVQGTSGDAVTVHVWEMDADTFLAINQPIIPHHAKGGTYG